MTGKSKVVNTQRHEYYPMKHKIASEQIITKQPASQPANQPTNQPNNQPAN
jgi:hypothetical protein